MCGCRSPYHFLKLVAGFGVTPLRLSNRGQQVAGSVSDWSTALSGLLQSGNDFALEIEALFAKSNVLLGPLQPSLQQIQVHRPPP